MKRVILALAIISLTFGICLADDSDYKSGELLVRFLDGSSERIQQELGLPLTKEAALGELSETVILGSYVDKTYERISDCLSLVKLPVGVTVEEAVAEFYLSGEIIYAEPNYRIRANLVPNDTYYNLQWALENRGQTGGFADADIDAEEAWDWEVGIEPNDPNKPVESVDGRDFIIVAVADTGIDFTHPDLAANMLCEPNDDPNVTTGVVLGYDFINNDSNAMDDHLHGTHVAGTIGAVGNNEMGITGVCWHVRLMPLKILDSFGYGYTSLSIDAIDFAIDNGARVYNASYGGGGESNAVLEAIQRAEAAGMVVVCAAGNDGMNNDYIPHYPSSYDSNNIISVAATDHYDLLANYSNYGEESVDIGAPGTDILSTFPTYMTDEMVANDFNENYAIISGTSMATPHVSGAAALMLSADPNLTVEDLKLILMVTGDKLTSLNGMVVSGRRLNLGLAVKVAANPGLVINTKAPAVTYPTIQEAIDDAADEDELIAKSGCFYIENIDFGDKNLIIRSGDIEDPNFGEPMPGETFIVSPSVADKAVTISGGQIASMTRLEGFTITNSDGIYVASSSATIKDCFIEGNGTGIAAVDSSGSVIEGCLVSVSGDVAIDSNSSVVDINNCEISENSAGLRFYNGSDFTVGNSVLTNNTGRGIDCNNSDVTITSSEISGNVSVDNGAGLYACGNSDVFVRETAVSGNQSWESGGGIYIDEGAKFDIGVSDITGNLADQMGGGVYLKGNLGRTIADCNVVGNRSEMFGGGGIYVELGDLDLLDSLVASNTTGWDGAGIYFDTAGGFVFNCDIQGNDADYYGGAAVLMNCMVMPEFINCLVRDNVSTNEGGGFYIVDSDAIFSVCTFVNNGAKDTEVVGGAIYFTESDFEVYNSIFYQNDDIAIYSPEDVVAGSVRLENNLFYDNADGDYGYLSSVFYAGGDPDLNVLAGMSDNIGLDPQFVVGPLGEYYLAQEAAGQIVTPESPAVDAGKETVSYYFLDDYTTRTDGEDDSNDIDMGYHYIKQAVDMVNLRVEAFGDDAAHGTLTYTDVNGVEVTLWADDVSNVSGYRKFSEVRLVADANSDSYFSQWMGADGENIYDPNELPIYRTHAENYVVMNGNRSVRASFITRYVLLRCRVADGAGTVTPREVTLPRGSIVKVTATPDDLSEIVFWDGSDDDAWTGRENQVSLINDIHQVEVRFYSPKHLYVGADSNYPTIQLAIEAAGDGDIIVLSPDTYNIYQASEDSSYLWVSGKAFTLTGDEPDEPDKFHIIGGFVIADVGRDTIIQGVTITGRYGGGTVATITGTNEDGSGHDGFNGSCMNGGGMEILGSASPTVRNCVFSGCWIRGNNGGQAASGCPGGDGGWAGWAHGGGASCGIGSKALFVNCRFEDCIAQGGDGGNGGSGTPCLGGHGGNWGIKDRYPWWVSNSSHLSMPWDEWDGWEWAREQRDGSYGWDEPYWKYSGYGGAVYCGLDSAPEFEDCEFVDNEVQGGSSGVTGDRVTPGFPTNHYRIDCFGGAVYIDGRSTARFTNCVFTDNEANDVEPKYWRNDTGQPIVNAYTNVAYGGAIAFECDSKPIFDNCIINGNIANMGGGIYGTWSEAGIAECEITQNVADTSGGGMLLVGGSSQIVTSMFKGNLATSSGGRGGGICVLGASPLIADSEISGNECGGHGGGIYVSSKDLDSDNQYVPLEDVNGDPVEIDDCETLLSNCLITGNAATNGGGIEATWHSNPYIVNCTVSNNVATQIGGYGGGLLSAYVNHSQIVNSIFWDNIADNGREIAIRPSYEPSVVSVRYSNIQGGGSFVQYPGVGGFSWADENCELQWLDGNLSGTTMSHPLFVPGDRGNYYLSDVNSTYSEQEYSSPCIDAGVGDPNSLIYGNYRYTTQNGNGNEIPPIDMGYHYVKAGAFTLGDLDYNCVVNNIDQWILLQYWLEQCTFPLFCQGTDLNKDGVVNWTDHSMLLSKFTENDIEAPTPNPMTWYMVPTATSTTSVKMIATKAMDNAGADVAYYFTCFGDPNFDSGWLRYDVNGMPEYELTGLDSGTEYCFRVKCADLSSVDFDVNDMNSYDVDDYRVGNVTAWSNYGCVVPGGESPNQGDVTPPNPNPMTWDSPAYIAEANQVTLFASEATDDSGDVEYYFEVIDPNTGEGGPLRDVVTGEMWWSANTIVHVNLPSETEFCYRVRARDTSLRKNMTDWSEQICVTTLEDGAVPTTDPNIIYNPYMTYNDGADTTRSVNSGQFKSGSYWYYVIVIEVGETDQDYFNFKCGDLGPISSGWIPRAGAGELSTAYGVVIYSDPYIIYRVRASTSTNNWSWTVCSATTAEGDNERCSDSMTIWHDVLAP